MGQIWGNGGVPMGAGWGEKLSTVVVKICRYFIKTAFLWENALLQGNSLALLCLCGSNKIRNFREIGSNTGSPSEE